VKCLQQELPQGPLAAMLLVWKRGNADSSEEDMMENIHVILIYHAVIQLLRQQSADWLPDRVSACYKFLPVKYAEQRVPVQFYHVNCDRLPLLFPCSEKKL